jgi:hypothetical protein
VRILRLDVAPGEPYTGLSLAGDRWVACSDGEDLRLIDLAGERGEAAIAGGARHALGADVLVTCTQGRLRRHLRDGATWREAGEIVVSELVPWVRHPVLSPSGRRLACELPPLVSGEPGRAVLLDLERGEVLADHPCHIASRAHFVVDRGRERLMLSATTYMSVLLLDAEDGRTLRSFEPERNAFCHTHYYLSPDGARLLAFGCWWAAPYETRLYDIAVWFAGAGEGPLPQPRLTIGEVFSGVDLVLPSRFLPASDGLVDSPALVDAAQLPAPGSEDAESLEDCLEGMEQEVYKAVRAAGPRRLLLVRRIDPVAAEVVGWSLVPVTRVDERHVHTLPGHRFVLVGDVVQRWDCGAAAPVDAQYERPPGTFESVVTSDGETVVCARRRGP